MTGANDVLLPAVAGAFHDRPDALTAAGQRMSWEQLAGAAAAFADRIAGADALAVEAGPSLATVVAVVAGLLAGVPLVPYAPDSSPRERQHILGDSGADMIAGQLDGGDGGEGGLPVVAVDLGLAGRSAGRFPEPVPDSTAFLLYTSGTTGAPKGVPVSRRAIATDLDALAEAWQWTSADTLVHGLPLYHVHGLVLGVLGALRTGSALVHTGRATPAAYAGAGGTLYFGVPTIWSRIAADPPAARALAPARLLVSGSAALPTSVFEALATLSGHRPVERYGMTETLITLSTCALRLRRPGTVGGPLAGVLTRLADEAGRPVPHDGAAMGELHVTGPTVFRGYHHRPEATAASFSADGWFRTGDLATIGPDGTHRIVGRVSVDLITSGGYRIGAGEIEDALLACPAVTEAAVVGEPHVDLGQEIVAYVVAAGVTPEQVIDHVAGQLSAHKRPRRVHIVDSLPRNAIGKVLKQDLGGG